MMSTCCSKHVEAWNKYIEKESDKLAINQNYVEMHGRQNILKKHCTMKSITEWSIKLMIFARILTASI
jgi:hypothetical protein